MRHLILALALLALAPAMALIAAPTAAVAQQASKAPDYESWTRTAKRASEAIESSRASTAALEDLRTQLVDWRDIFSAAQKTNSNAITTAQNQLDALGPPPDDGSESEEVAGQRAQLTDQLGRLQAPVKTAQLAYSQADGMIKGIDRIIRERQARQWLEVSPSPLNPVHWPAGVSALYETFDSVRVEITKYLRSDIQRAETWRTLPVVVVLVLIGLVLMLRGRYWVELAVRLVLPGSNTSARWIITLLLSLGEMVVPFVGLLIFIKALYLSNLVGLRGDLLLIALKPAVLIVLITRWLALRCFPRSDLHRLPLALDGADRRAGRLYGGALGIVIAVFYFIRQMAAVGNWSVEANNVVLFPVMVVSGLLLLRLARLLAKHSQAAAQDETLNTYRNRLTRLMSRALYALAIVAPTLAAIGYFQAAERLMLPSLLSLLMLAALLIVQRVVTEVYVLLSSNREGAADELVPVLAGFIIVVLSAPIFALIWGARVADLTELWIQFTQGIKLGELTISPSIFLTLALVFSVGLIMTRLLQGTLKNTVLPKTKMDQGGRNAVVSGIGYIGIFLSAIIAITSAGIDLSSIAIVAGALSVGIGFGLQNIVSNFVSGIILLIERPISQGDWIEVGGLHGTVRQISVRSTRIETFDRSDLIIPNSDLVSGTVTNYTRGNTVGRVIVPVGVAFNSDTREVERILREIAKAHPMVLMNPEPNVVFTKIGESTFDFEIRAILRDVNWIISVKSDMNHAIAKRFGEEGIEMAFAQRDIWLRNPEALFPPGIGHPSAPEADSAPAASSEGQSGGSAQRVDDSDSDTDGDPDTDGDSGAGDGGQR